jgi:rhomboid family GlyGly-CTERM serine protease
MPVLTGAVMALLVTLHLLPAAGELLIFERAAVAGGDFWRPLTGNLVHFSWRHLALDAALLGVAGALVERRNRGTLALLLAGSAAAAGLAVLLLPPGYELYAGSSGMAVAVLTWAALDALREPTPARRWIARSVLLALVIRLLLDAGGERLLAPGGVLVDPVAVAWPAHVAGALYALTFFAAAHARRVRRARHVRRARRPRGLAATGPALVAALLLPGITGGCAPLQTYGTGHRSASAAAALIELAARPTDGGQVAPALPPYRLQVAFVTEQPPGTVRTVLGERSLAAASAEQKAMLTARLVAALRQHPLVHSAESLPPLGVEGGAALVDALAAAAGAASATPGDGALLLLVGFDQLQQVTDRFALPLGVASLPFVILGAAADTAGAAIFVAAAGYVGFTLLAALAPTQRIRTTTLLDVTAYDTGTGRVVFRAPATARRERSTWLPGLGAALRTEGERGLEEAATSLADAVRRRLEEAAATGEQAVATPAAAAQPPASARATVMW